MNAQVVTLLHFLRVLTNFVYETVDWRLRFQFFLQVSVEFKTFVGAAKRVARNAFVHIAAGIHAFTILPT